MREGTREGESGGRKEGGMGKSSQSLLTDESNDIHTSLTPNSLLEPEFAPGMRIIVTGDNSWDGYRGIIISQNGDSWWVLLDHVVAQNSTTKNLFKSNQIEIEGIANNTNTQEVLAQTDKPKTSQEQEFANKVLQEATAELQKVLQQKEELAQKLLEKESESEKARLLQLRNQQLEQRIAELEKALEKVNQNDRSHKSNNQGNTVISSDLEEKIVTQTNEIKRLNNNLLSIEAEIAQLKAINEKQQAEIEILSQGDTSYTEEIIAQLGEIGEHCGWNGWSIKGYCGTNGILHKGINAIAAFISDFSKEYNYQT